MSRGNTDAETAIERCGSFLWAPRCQVSGQSSGKSKVPSMAPPLVSLLSAYAHFLAVLCIKSHSMLT
jgi:hypothetical protein